MCCLLKKTRGMRTLVGLGTLSIFWVTGCGHIEPTLRSEVQPDQDMISGTGIESIDIRTVAQKMARSLIGIPVIADATAAPTIAILPVVNRTRFIIDKEIFTTKIRSELNQHSNGKVIFLARERLEEVQQERDRKRKAEFDGATEERIKGADYFLTGELRGLSKAQGASISDYLFYDFHLINAETDAMIWEDSYEVKRVGVEGTVYR